MIKIILALLHICLLTHKNELDRLKTNTGQLVTSESLSKYQFESSIICWSGRNDNNIIEQRIKSFTSTPILLWTEGTNNFTSIDVNSNNVDHGKVYIVIDGTWQEAERIYRKGPAVLRYLPKLFISPTSPSRYRLRKNFGYIDKYSRDKDSNLLCTAEICADILQKEGIIGASQRILEALDNLQNSNDKETISL